MSSKSKRRPPIPPRPQLFNEQMRQQILDQTGGQPKTLSRDQSIELMARLALQLEQMLNGDQRLPWVTSSLEKRSDGFSLHVQVVEPSMETDAVVMG